MPFRLTVSLKEKNNQKLQTPSHKLVGGNKKLEATKKVPTNFLSFFSLLSEEKTELIKS